MSSSSSSADEGKVTDSFWNSCYDSIIQKTERHPFLVKMVDGTLPMDAFQYYVVQDALYLEDFASCLFALSDAPEAKANGTSERLKGFAIGAKEAEMSLHESFFVKWNISAEGVKQKPNTLLYTSYMARVVQTRPHAEGLAVLLPCFWVYMHVGKLMLELRTKLDGDRSSRPEQFDAWIEMYGGEEFEEEVTDYIQMVENICKDQTSETLAAMKEHFIMCCRLEHMFWDQALVLMEWPTIEC